MKTHSVAIRIILLIVLVSALALPYMSLKEAHAESAVYTTTYTQSGVTSGPYIYGAQYPDNRYYYRDTYSYPTIYQAPVSNNVNGAPIGTNGGPAWGTYSYPYDRVVGPPAWGGGGPAW